MIKTQLINHMPRVFEQGYIANSLGTFKVQFDQDGLIEVQKTEHVIKSTEKLVHLFQNWIKRNRVIFYGVWTNFQKQVYEELLKTKIGDLQSYQGLALNVSPQAVRAVGTALGKNKIPIFIPCHRIIRKNGNLGNYALGREFKQKLIELEKKGVSFYDVFANYSS